MRITKEMVERELEILSQLLNNHDCPETRQLVAEATASVYIAHSDVHSSTSNAAQLVIDHLVDDLFMPFRQQLSEIANKIENEEDQAKVLARITYIFLKFASSYAAKTAAVSYVAKTRPVKVAEPVQFDKSASPEDAIKKLLELPVSKTKN